MIKYYLKWYWKYFKLNFGFWRGMPGELVPTWKDWFGNNWPVSYNKYFKMKN